MSSPLARSFTLAASRRRRSRIIVTQYVELTREHATKEYPRDPWEG